MSLSRRLVILAATFFLPVGLLTLTATPSWAKAAAQPGSVTCLSITGTIKFSPALTTAGGKSSDTITFSTKSSGCAATGGGISPTGGSSVTKLTATSNACAAVLQSGTVGVGTPVTIKWAPSSKIAPSIVTFSSHSSTQSPNVTLSLSGATATGSYTGSDGGASTTTTLDISQSSSDILTACGAKAGVKELTIDGGSIVVG